MEICSKIGRVIRDSRLRLRVFFFAQIARKSKDLIFSKNIDKKVRLDFEGFLTLIRITIDFSRVFLHCMNFYELKKIYMAVK